MYAQGSLLSVVSSVYWRSQMGEQLFSILCYFICFCFNVYYFLLVLSLVCNSFFWFLQVEDQFTDLSCILVQAFSLHILLLDPAFHSSLKICNVVFLFLFISEFSNFPGDFFVSLIFQECVEFSCVCESPKFLSVNGFSFHSILIREHTLFDCSLFIFQSCFYC